MTEATANMVMPDRTNERPGHHLQVALGWRDILEDQFALQGTCHDHPDPLSLNGANAHEQGKPTAWQYSLNLLTQRCPLPGELIAIRVTGGAGLMGFIAKTQRLPDGWTLTVELVSRGYSVLKARTTDAMWPDGNRETADVIDFYPADLPSGQRSLLIKASRTSSLALCMPWAIELEGNRWVRASKPQHKGHLVVTTWLSSD